MTSTQEMNEAKRIFMKKNPHHTGNFDPNEIVKIIYEERAKRGEKVFISVIGPLYPTRKKPKNTKR